MKIGDLTDKGRVIWIDNPWTQLDGKPADILVKTDLPNEKARQNFTWFRLSELTQVEDKPKEIPKMLNDLGILKEVRKDLELVYDRAGKINPENTLRGWDKKYIITKRN